jgi:hypothetical protein
VDAPDLVRQGSERRSGGDVSRGDRFGNSNGRVRARVLATGELDSGDEAADAGKENRERSQTSPADLTPARLPA